MSILKNIEKKTFNKIGLFFGSFNPIHMGHLIVANYIVEFSDLEEIWFVVSPQNPFKKGTLVVDAQDRFNMVKMAIKGYEKIKTTDIEFNLPRPSFTINTLNVLEKKYLNTSFCLVIGDDLVKDFPKWKDYKIILEKFPLYIYPRSRSKINLKKSILINNQIKQTYFLNAPLIEISSSFIRDSIKEKKNITSLIPSTVVSYIKEKKLYQ